MGDVRKQCKKEYNGNGFGLSVSRFNRIIVDELKYYSDQMRIAHQLMDI